MTEEQSATSAEFEREPVPQHALLGFKSFVGMYAGEHVAGTELMIGPLFIASGVSAFDLIVGLLLGNLLAVLSWMTLTAPIATRTRLTLYYQLEKICGRQLVTLYNLANGVMFCFLAGAMITVSATALGPIFNLPMPSLTDVYPNSLGWVIATVVVGAAIAIVAALGIPERGQVRQRRRALDGARVPGLRRGGRATIPRRHRCGNQVGQRRLATGEHRHLERWRSAAGPDEIHFLARDCSSPGSATWRCTSACRT